MSHVTEDRQHTSSHRTTGGYLAGVRDVVVLELKQRLRSRGWYIMLAIWFVLTGLVTWLTWASWNASQAAQRGIPGYVPPPESGPGSMIFEVVLAFVLLFALLVAPALSANAVNGDRAGGTLAILQVTLLQPGQILVGQVFRSMGGSTRVPGGQHPIPGDRGGAGWNDAGPCAGGVAHAGC
jgi:hypothetical protein